MTIGSRRPSFGFSSNSMTKTTLPKPAFSDSRYRFERWLVAASIRAINVFGQGLQNHSCNLGGIRVRPPISLTHGSIWLTLLRLSVPIILANVLQTAYAVTDTFWVGRLSQEAVAAVSLSFPINFLLIAVGGGLPIAGTVLIAQYHGRGDRSAMNHIAAQTMIMSFLVSLVLSVGGYFISEPLMRFMGAAPEVLPDATSFMRMTFLGFLFVFGF